MASKELTLTGIAKWVRAYQPDEKYNNYTIDLYMDDRSFNDFLSSGSQVNVKQNEDGRFVTFRRPHVKLIKNDMVVFGPPAVGAVNPDTGKFELWGEYVDATSKQSRQVFKPKEGSPSIGNGSTVTVAVEIYDTQKGSGTRLNAIRVDNLVEYKKPDVASDTTYAPRTPF